MAKEEKAKRATAKTDKTSNEPRPVVDADEMARKVTTSGNSYQQHLRALFSHK